MKTTVVSMSHSHKRNTKNNPTTITLWSPSYSLTYLQIVPPFLC